MTMYERNNPFAPLLMFLLGRKPNKPTQAYTTPDKPIVGNGEYAIKDEIIAMM